MYFTVQKKELLNNTLLLGLKFGWSIATILYIARKYNFQIAHIPIWTSVSDVDMKSCTSASVTYPPQVLCLIVSRGCNSKWCLFVCGHVDIREIFQVLVGRLHNFKLAIWICVTKWWNKLKFLLVFHTFPRYICLLKHVTTHYIDVQNCPKTLY